MSGTHLKGTLRSHEGWGPHNKLAQLLPEMLPIGLKTLGPGFESLGRRKELSGNEDIL